MASASMAAPASDPTAACGVHRLTASSPSNREATKIHSVPAGGMGVSHEAPPWPHSPRIRTTPAAPSPWNQRVTTTGVPAGSGIWTVPLKMTRSGEPA